MPEAIEATFRIVTPMFLGGGNQSPDDGIRPPSVKGALRFWWRALNWGRFRAEASCDETALMLLHAEEVRLLGGSSEQGGQGCFQLAVLSQPPRNQTVSDWPHKDTGAGYLAFGILESGSPAKGNFQPHRRAILESNLFSLRLTFRPNTPSADLDSVRESIDAWSLFGGLGSRSRRGMGSITRIEDDRGLLSLPEYDQQAQELIAKNGLGAPAPHSAFSQATLFRTLATGKDARQALGSAGQAFKNHRGQPSSLRGEDKIPFGLPLQGVDENARRASPLLFHVHAIADQQFAASVLYLPSSVFHPVYPDVPLQKVADFLKEARR